MRLHVRRLHLLHIKMEVKTRYAFVFTAFQVKI